MSDNPNDNNTLASIMEVFNNFLAEKKKYANEQVAQVNTVFSQFSNIVLAQSSNLVSDISNENILLDKQIIANNSVINRAGLVNWKYQQVEVDNLKYQNHILFIVFYILLLVLCAVMWYYDTVSFVMQCIIFHVLLLYPFIIYYMELFIYIIWSYLYAYFYNVPYESVYVGSG